MGWAQAVLSSRLWAHPAQAPVPGWLTASPPEFLFHGQRGHAPGSPGPSTNPESLGRHGPRPGALPPARLVCPSRNPICNCSLSGTRSAKRVGDGQLLTREAAPTPSLDQFKFLV